MCQISNKIKFCTCEVANTDELVHYWKLLRFNSKRKFDTVGETMLPHYDENFEIGAQTLIKVLNKNSAFDQPIKFQSKDVLL
jgi:hypothetical protein